MPSYRLDLHIHSPSSACFDGDAVDGYGAIITEASNKCLDMIAVTDHHSAAGIRKLQSLGREQKINVLPGVELTCRIGDIDEIFLLAIFPEDFAPERIGELLRGWKVPPRHFGFGGFVLPVAVEDVIDGVDAAGGLVISSRADKTPYRRNAIPELVRRGVRLYDLVYPESEGLVFSPFTRGTGRNLHFFTFSDSHAPRRVGERFSNVVLPSPSFRSLLEKAGEKS